MDEPETVMESYNKIMELLENCTTVPEEKQEQIEIPEGMD